MRGRSVVVIEMLTTQRPSSFCEGRDSRFLSSHALQYPVQKLTKHHAGSQLPRGIAGVFQLGLMVGRPRKVHDELACCHFDLN